MKKVIHTEAAPAAIGPYSQGTAFNDLVFVSGQIPLDPNTMVFVDGGIKEQTRQVMTNLQAVLKESGASLGSVLKTTCLLSDMENFAAFNEVYAEFFGTEGAPARACFAAAGLPKGALVEVEAVAFKQ
ncbi:Rid family detoxifying hydrolase [Marinobacter sp. AL4B]|uniref:Rid family detoxifying hydrolase n=1 Tax=Marinobacter sp. AL4B TaxID=2871173 RepID=UPI001CAA497F|nr:Rid family detoxifying hydrolase [Marinobacter sp. AL4B]MBZ0333555.1 Rid family detoxifying hydrolase [Marinobacter sp. AL4B]